MEFSAQHIIGALNQQGVKAELWGASDATAKNLSIDSRTISGNEIFVPLRSQDTGRDGHDFISDALNKGASGAKGKSDASATGGCQVFFVARDYFEEKKSQLEELTNTHKAAVIIVPDTQLALTALAKHVRKDRLDEAKVIAITGSVGKTSTKDLTYWALCDSIKTSCSKHSQNNHLGIPLTLGNASKGTKALVAEVGTSSRGEIAKLAATLQPDIGVVTSIGVSHMTGFKNVAAIRKEKGDLIAALPKGGVAILNADEGGSLSVKKRTKAQVLTYGTDPETPTNLYAANITLDENLCASFELELNGMSDYVDKYRPLKIKLPVAGSINVKNALAGLAVAAVVGVDLEAAASSISKAQLSPNRMQLIIQPNGLKILNDTYNANPISMNAALQELRSLDARHHIAVLGRMHELGKVSKHLHRQIAALATRLGVKLISYKEPAYGVKVYDDDALKEYVAQLGAEHAILYKASRAVGLEKMITEKL